MKGGPKNTIPIHDYCFKNKIAAMGWGLDDKNADIKSGKISINSYADYEKYAANEYKKRDFANVERLACKAQPGDFIWTRANGEYYLAKISADSKYRYNYRDEAIENEACNELTNIDWKFVGDSNVVDTNIINYSQGPTFCQLIDPDKDENKNIFEKALEYTQKVYDKL